MKTMIRTVAVASTALLLCACHWHLFEPAARPWILVNGNNNELPGYLSYVLFGPEPQAADQKLQQSARNRALLKAITQAPADGTQPALTAAQSNLFCIPAHSDKPEAKPEIDNYDGGLAASYRGSFDARLRGSHAERLLGMRLDGGRAQPWSRFLFLLHSLGKRHRYWSPS